MQKNKGFGAKALEFAEDKGFYIILVLCAVAIGISGYVLFFTGAEADGIAGGDLTAGFPSDIVTEPKTEVPKVDVGINDPSSENDKGTGGGANTDVPGAGEVPPVKQPTLNSDIQQAEVSKPAANPVKIKTPEFVYPVDGEVLKTFSNGELVLDETMADWRTHNGTDFAAELNASVYAISDGTVSEIYFDELLGNCVVITHEDNIVSTYCGLAANTTLRTGMKVSAGDVIGGVGDTMLIESAQETHIHVEVLKNGKLIDPMSLIK